MSEPMGTPPAEEADPAPEPTFPQANAVAVKAIAGALASTLGPTPRDKLVVESVATRQNPRQGIPATDEFVVTSDGATILERLPLEHPIAPIVTRMVGPERPGETDIEGRDIRDGVSTSVVIAAALLDEAIDLVERGVHPQSVVRGYDAARDIAADVLATEARPVESFDDPNGVLQAVAETAMTGNDVGGIADRLARYAREVVAEVGVSTEKTLSVRQVRDGSIDDSRLVRGAVLDRNSRADDEMPRRVEDASVLVLGGHDRGGLDVPELDEELTASVDSVEDVESFERIFDDWRADVCTSIRQADVDVVVTELGIDSDFMSFLAENGIVGIRSVNRIDLTQVARATGATIVKDPRNVETEHLGNAGVVEEQTIEPREGGRKRRRMTVFDECTAPDSVSVVLRGVDDYLGEQATTGLRKAGAAVAAATGSNGDPSGVVSGGGAIDARIAAAVRDASNENGSRAALAMDAFADAIEQVPVTLARNGGLDPITTMADLRVANGRDEEMGLVFPGGEIDDVVAAGVLDPAATRLEGYHTATDVAMLLLRVDDAVDATFSQEDPDPDDVIFDEPTTQ